MSQNDFGAAVLVEKVDRDDGRLKVGVFRNPGERETRRPLDRKVFAPMRVVAATVVHHDSKLSANPRIDFGGRAPDVSGAHPVLEALGIEPRIEDLFARNGNDSPDDEKGRLVLVAHERGPRARGFGPAAPARRRRSRKASIASSRSSQYIR